jgi:outer membrane protein assembly factor BamA
LTLALRAFHYGRYFGDSESKLLTPFFLGNQTLIRGYTLSSIDLNQSTDEGKTVPALDRLLGSRIAVINTELRIPIIGTDRFGLINFPYVPLELSAFIDAGLAWTASNGPAWEFSRKSGRGPVVSTGAAARVGILGAFVLQLYYAYPFQKVHGGSEFGLLLSPGW